MDTRIQTLPVQSLDRSDLDAVGFDSDRVDDATFELLATRLEAELDRDAFLDLVRDIADEFDLPHEEEPDMAQTLIS